MNFLHKLWPASCALFLLFAAADANAQAPSRYTSRDRFFNIQRFAQSPSPGRYIMAEPAETLRHLELAASFFITGGAKPLRLFGAGDERRVWVDHIVAGVFTFAVGLFDRVQLELTVPYTISDACGKTGERQDYRQPVPGPDDVLPVCGDVEAALGKYSSAFFNGGGLNDLTAGVKVAFLRRRGHKGFGLSAGLDVSFPVDRGGPFRGEGNVPDVSPGEQRDVGENLTPITVAPRLAVDYVGERMRFALNLGYRFRRRSVFLPGDDGLIIDDQLVFAGAVEVSIIKRLSALAEINGAMLASSDVTALETPVEALIGARYAFTPNLALTVGGGTGVVYGYGVPTFRLFAGVSYAFTVQNLDPDGDGILGDNDRCPTRAEDKDGFQDEDGCPDPDNDNDGIPDEKDACPNVFAKTPNGCPIEKPKDTDGDGIPDKTDKCPNEPEDKDGFQDDDGCPDLDNDGDGIPDLKDKCPNEPETINGYQDEDGCPDTVPTKPTAPPELKIAEMIFFGVGQTKVSQEMKRTLDEIAKRIAANPRFRLLRVEGHSSSSGSKRINMRLSTQRAKAVRAYLISKGVDARKLQAVGYGAKRPLGANNTDEGRAKNRRVEIIVVR